MTGWFWGKTSFQRKQFSNANKKVFKPYSRFPFHIQKYKQMLIFATAAAAAAVADFTFK